MQPHSTNAIGRRKTSVARIILSPGTGKFIVNQRPLDEYFPIATLQAEVIKPFAVTGTAGRYDVRANVEGGGWTGQAGAICLGISRALVDISEDFRSPLRAASFLTRDPRMVERKKYGQKKARKRFQFSKR